VRQALEHRADGSSASCWSKFVLAAFRRRDRHRTGAIFEPVFSSHSSAQPPILVFLEFDSGLACARVRCSAGRRTCLLFVWRPDPRDANATGAVIKTGGRDDSGRERFSLRRLWWLHSRALAWCW